jgi:hypothetical protein
VSDQDNLNGDPDATPTESEEHRAEERVPLWLHGATLREPGCSAAPVTVQDLSQNGFRVAWPYRLHSESTVYLKLPEFEIMPAHVVWCADFQIGCKFDRPLSSLIYERIVTANAASG